MGVGGLRGPRARGPPHASLPWAAPEASGRYRSHDPRPRVWERARPRPAIRAPAARARDPAAPLSTPSPPPRLITAIKTPYRTNGKIDLAAYDALVAVQVAAGVDGLVVGGTTGEGQLMSWDEHVMLIAHTVNGFGGEGGSGRGGVGSEAAVVAARASHPATPSSRPSRRQTPGRRQHGVERDPGSPARVGARVCRGHARRAPHQPLLR